MRTAGGKVNPQVTARKTVSTINFSLMEPFRIRFIHKVLKEEFKLHILSVHTLYSFSPAGTKYGRLESG